MKNPLLPCTLAALVIGIGAGWMLKPSHEAGRDPEPDAAKAVTKEGAVAVAGGASEEGGVARSRSGLRGPREKKGGIIPAEASEGARKMLASMEERRAKRTEARIAELVAKLGLNAQQEARLRAHFDAEKPEVKVEGDDGALRVNSMMKMSPQEREASLDKLMDEMLTGEQQAAYESFKETEKNQQVEARALRDMASLTQAVDLRDDQRDAVYEILQNEARAGVGQPVDAVMASVGVFGNAEFGAGPGGEAALVQMNVRPDAEGMSQEEIMAQVQEQQQAQIDAKVERLSGVLDAAQLAAYRSHLEQGPVMIGP